MQSENAIAFKEWAAICYGLETGQQQIILRKGGIHEGREGFRVAHQEFWLYPTTFHQDGNELTPTGRNWLSQVREQLPPAGQLSIQLYAVVRHVDQVTNWDDLAALRNQHGLSDETVHKRFIYREPGLFVLHVDVYQRSTPLMITELPRYAGCRSWVELDTPLPTAELEPIVPVNPSGFGQ